MKVRLGFLLATVACGTMSWANSEYLDAFLSNYKIADTSPLAEKSCGLCHISDSDFGFNAYGKDVKKVMTDKGTTDVDGPLLASIESNDSDGDGVSNGEEIAAGKDPAHAEGGTAAAAAAETPKKKAAFPPKNAYHPAVVHFPIALFIAALLLDFYGLVRKDRRFLWAGWCNMVMAAVTALGGIITGYVAMVLLKVPMKGLILEHMLYALAASFLMWIMVSLRVHRHESMNLAYRAIYYLAALACFLMISWAGHLGGVFVYGE